MDHSVLMGHAPAKVDEKGRLKVPNAFRRVIDEKYGSDCFITSLDGANAVIYPLPVWQELLGRLSRVPSTSLAKTKFLERANYFGQVSGFDTQGRLLIPSILRDVAQIKSDVVVLGNQDHLIVWNEATIQKRLADAPLTPDDMKELELHGV